MIDLLTLGESRQMVAVAEKIRTALLTAGDIYLLSTFRLPPKQGGVLFGLYSRQDNTRWLEASVVGKINKVLVRYQREDGKVHAVNLQQAGLADGRTHTALLRLRGPSRPSPALQLYVDCKLGDQHAGLPALAPIPPAEVNGLEIRTGQKAYLRMQGFVESMKMILGGSMARVGALSECPFQGDESIHSAVASALHSILGEQTKALVTQLTLFNQILVELRDDIRDQVKEMSLIRNTIMECQVCGFHEQRSHCSPNPCFRGVDCMEVYEYPGYRCGPCPPASRATAPTALTSMSALTPTLVSRAPVASTPCPASTVRPVPEATKAHGCLAWALTMPGPASRSATISMNAMMGTTAAVTQTPSAPILWALSSVVPVAWASWATRAMAASRPGPATAQPTAPAMSTRTVSLNAMVQCPACATWAGPGMGTCAGLTQTLMATRTRRCPAWTTTNTASRTTAF